MELTIDDDLRALVPNLSLGVIFATLHVRLRRTKVEYAFVSVPVDEHVWEQHPDDPKERRINGEMVFESAKRMGRDPSVLWAQESEPIVEIHPWQIAPPRA